MMRFELGVITRESISDDKRDSEDVAMRGTHIFMRCQFSHRFWMTVPNYNIVLYILSENEVLKNPNKS